MIELNDENFLDEVIEADGVIVVEFWGNQCAKCKEIMPLVEELADINKHIAKFCKLNAMENKQLSISQNVASIPTIVIYQKGEKEAQFNRVFSIQDVQIKLQEIG